MLGSNLKKNRGGLGLALNLPPTKNLNKSASGRISPSNAKFRHPAQDPVSSSCYFGGRRYRIQCRIPVPDPGWSIDPLACTNTAPPILHTTGTSNLTAFRHFAGIGEMPAKPAIIPLSLPWDLYWQTASKVFKATERLFTIPDKECLQYIIVYLS